MTADDRVQQIALVSQRNEENRHKNTISHVISASHPAFTVIERQSWSEKTAVVGRLLAVTGGLN